ncbi:hypothetical protein RFN29_11760 [Mesorhizobium sp. VK22B]|uniref:Uncharacterized protein n=1 Tax=Mesorhizobium captivum TaxID=3072319 RepID=A0ABU4YZL5_9HYPH|nr:hypothetical protein [Mesorhizobium sp. VK22B]MDX8492258.1 hypothetical protein [Mesorhizobium sp. VK22B]
MQPELQRLIDDCYAAFASYPPPRKLHVSPLRDSVAILESLTSAPLRELTGEQIGPYAGWAMTTVGDVADYKHFLPRILEQAVRESLWTGTDPPIIANRLKMAQWQDWPDAERGAIRALFAGAFSQAIEGHPDDGDDAEDWICGIAILDLSLSATLDAWLAAPSMNAALQLATFLTRSCMFEADPVERAYWSYVDAPTAHLVRRWLLSDRILQRLSSARGWTMPSDQWLIDKALATHAARRLERLQ